MLFIRKQALTSKGIVVQPLQVIMNTIRNTISIPHIDDTYERIDTKVYDKFGEHFDVKNLSIQGTWNGMDMVERYEVYRKVGCNEIECLIQFGGAIGRPGIIHGGITSLILDNSFGWLYIALNNTPPAVTANLNINFRKPIYAYSNVILRLNLIEVKERKIYMSAVMKDNSKEILVEATSLFVVPKDFSMRC